MQFPIGHWRLTGGRARTMGGCILALCTVTICAWCTPVPLCVPESVIRSRLLRDTPIGATKQEVVTYVKRHGYTDVEDIPQGFNVDEPFTPFRRVGNSCIRGDLGRYWSPHGQVTVTAYWGFDLNGMLVDVLVRKCLDGL